MKLAYKEDWNEENLPDVEPESYPVLGKFIPVIDKWLTEDRKIPRKQRHTACRTYDRLRDELGFNGSYSSVKRYIRKKKYVMKMTNDGYLPLAQPKGCGQVDFGEFIYYNAAGAEQKAYALTVSFPYSNKGYTQAFPSQNQDCLLEGMKQIFERIGGVPIRLRFDNMTSAVAQVLKGTERVLTDSFTRFILHMVNRHSRSLLSFFLFLFFKRERTIRKSDSPSANKSAGGRFVRAVGGIPSIKETVFL